MTAKICYSVSDGVFTPLFLIVLDLSFTVLLFWKYVVALAVDSVTPSIAIPSGFYVAEAIVLLTISVFLSLIAIELVLAFSAICFKGLGDHFCGYMAE